MNHRPIRAIPTRYKGYFFRSRLEARWAVFFDHLGIKYEYEPEGFDLGNGLRYLPDFWLPEWRMWVEVKPGPPDDAAREKAWRLIRHNKHALFLAHGMPDDGGTLFLSHTQQGGEVGLFDLPALILWGNPSIIVFDQLGEFDEWVSCAVLCGVPPARQREAADLAVRTFSPALMAARGARFEFGQVGV